MRALSRYLIKCYHNYDQLGALAARITALEIRAKWYLSAKGENLQFRIMGNLADSMSPLSVS